MKEITLIEVGNCNYKLKKSWRLMTDDCNVDRTLRQGTHNFWISIIQNFGCVSFCVEQDHASAGCKNL